MSGIKMTKYLKYAFILLIVILLAQVVSSQKNQTTNKILNKTTETKISNNQQNTVLPPEQILIESQRNFDRTLNILNIVLTGIGILVALIAIFVTIAIGLGLFQYRRWSKIRKDAEKNLKYIQAIKKRVEQEVEESIKKIKEIPIEKISKEEIDYLKHRIEDLEIFGISSPYDLFVKGLSFYEKKDYESALKAYNKAIELKPNDEGIWNNKGIVLKHLGKHEDALKAYEKAIELKPNEAVMWYNKGSTLLKLGKFEEALKAFDKAIELDPNDSDAWFNRACYYSLKKNKKESLTNLKKAIELNSKSKEDAKKDEDFKFLREDKDFKKLVM